MEVLIGLVSVLLGAVAGALGTYVTTKARMRLELQLAYDRALRDLRLPHYQRLFHLSGCIPREWRPGEEPTRAELQHLREGFHDWYFGPDAGGLFLTQAAKDHYLRLQDELASLGTPAPSGRRSTRGRRA